jgi:hypothetical protein
MLVLAVSLPRVAFLVLAYPTIVLLVLRERRRADGWRASKRADEVRPE